MKRKIEEACQSNKKIRKESVPLDVFRRIIPFFVHSNTFIGYEDYISLILLCKPVKEMLEEVIMNFIYDNDPYFYTKHTYSKMSLIMRYYAYFKDVTFIKMMEFLSGDIQSTNDKVIIKEINDINYYHRTISLITLSNNNNKIELESCMFSNENYAETLYFNTRVKCSIFDDAKKMKNVFQTNDERVSTMTFNKMKRIFPWNIEVSNFHKYYLNCDDGHEAKVLGITKSIKKNLEKYPLLTKIIHNFLGVVGGSWVLYEVVGKPNNWIPNDIDIFLKKTFLQSIQNFLLSNKINFNFQIKEDKENFYQQIQCLFVLNDLNVNICFVDFEISWFVYNIFDINICKCFYDGKKVFTFCKKEYFDLKLFKRCGRYITGKTQERIEKYESRGFKKIDYNL